MHKAANQVDRERFHSGSQKYAAYLQTPEGRLRSDLTFANLQDFLPSRRSEESLTLLDLGGGTGAMAIRLAQLGAHLTLLDSSEEMLDIAKRAAMEAGVAESLGLKHGDAEQLTNLFPAGSFDGILCHNVLEYIDDPGAVLCAAAGVLRNPPAIVSILVRNQAGEAVKAAIQSRNLDAAEDSLTAEWGRESLFGGKVRLFNSEDVRSMLRTASLEIIAERGVRVIADYLPPSISREAEYDRILEFERKLGRRPEFAAIARHIHYLARRADPKTENRA